MAVQTKFEISPGPADDQNKASRTDVYLEGRIGALESLCKILANQLYTSVVVLSGVAPEDELSERKKYLENIADALDEAIQRIEKEQQDEKKQDDEYELGYLDGVKRMSESLRRTNYKTQIEE